MKKAIIIGSHGQDGQLLYSLLKQKKYSVIGIDIDHISCTDSTWNQIIDISEPNQVHELIHKVQPNHVYYLAAYHHSSEDDTGDTYECINNSYKVNVFSYLNFLEGIRKYSNETRIFYASSSHIFGNPKDSIQDELTKYDPQSIYAFTKLDGILLSRYYRENHSIFSSVGILYNHESHLRTENFVSKKIVKKAVQIKFNELKKLMLGDIHVQIDWGYALDYVSAMFKILTHNNPDEFIVSSGEKNILKDFVSMVFNYLGMDWDKYVIEDLSLIKRSSPNNLFGNPKKLMDQTGWKPKVNLKALVKLMVDYELKVRN